MLVFLDLNSIWIKLFFFSGWEVCTLLLEKYMWVLEFNTTKIIQEQPFGGVLRELIVSVMVIMELCFLAY